jgi:uncharacterized coiled-coil DUF342 family protein
VIPSQDQPAESSDLPSKDLETARLVQLIADLEAQLQDLQRRLPAHSLSPALQAEMDALDELLAQARRELALISNQLTAAQNP